MENNPYKTALIALIAAIVVGAAVYFLQQSKTNQIQEQVDELKQNNQQLMQQNQKPARPATSSTATMDNSQNQENIPNDETTKIIQKINDYCEKYTIPGCLPITSQVFIDVNDKFSVVKINGDANYLLTRKNNKWSVSIASKEQNICDTGSGNSDLIEYCNNLK